MEGLGASLQGIGKAVRKKRTHTFRRRPEPQSRSDSRDVSSLSSTPPLDDGRVGSSDENSGGGGNSSRRKKLSLSQCVSRFPGASVPESEKSVKKSKKIDVGLDELYGKSSLRGPNQNSEEVLAPVNYKTMALNTKTEGSSASQDVLGYGTVRKVKLKLGGVTHTIGGNSSLKSSQASDTASSGHKTITEDVLDSHNLPHRERRSGLRGIPWRDFSKAGVILGREESVEGKGGGKSGSGKQGEKPDSGRRSRRAFKKRAIDGLDDDEDDDEIRYLEKLKKARISSGFGEDLEESSRKHRRLSKFSSKSPQSSEAPLAKDGKRRSLSMDTDYDEDEEIISDGEPGSRQKKKKRGDPLDSPAEPKVTLTTRQRALQSGKDASTNGESVMEFPNGLPQPISGKPKEQLTEVEQQVRRAEAAQRRKMQNEKAARESEAEAIRKILGQDSSRKKKEDKKKKRVADLAQEKAADEISRASNTVRLVMGPNGTTVTFPNEMGLPSIFSSGPCSYPPAREKCAGPSCSNLFKYRDSKTKLPLCSLQCYKAVQGSVQSEAATC